MDNSTTSEFLRKFGLFCGSIAFILGCIIFAGFMLPIYTYRLCISYLSFVRPDLVKIIPSRSSVHVKEDCHSQDDSLIIVNTLAKGRVNVNTLRGITMRNIFDCKGVCEKYAELKQYPYAWMGFYFWKEEENFNICDHIYEYTCPQLEKDPSYRFSKEEAHAIWEYHISKPHKKNKSQWDIILVPNIFSESGEEQTGVHLRGNHAIGDGLSFLKIMLSLAGDENSLQQLESIKKSMEVNWHQKLLIFVHSVLFGPYQLLDAHIKANHGSIWRIVNPDLKNKNSYRISNQIPLRIVKEIAKKEDVSVTSVIYAAITSALRKALLENRGNVPYLVSTPLVLPMCGYSENLTNNWSLTFIQLPVGEMDAVKRLNAVHATIQMTKTSTAHVVLFYLVPLLTSLFKSMGRHILQKTSSMTMSNSLFIGQKSKVLFGPYEMCSQSYVTLGVVNDRNPVFIATLTSNENIQMTITGNDSFFKKHQLDEFLENIEEEVHNLHKRVS